MSDQLLAGVAEVDITPAVGTMLCGSLKPRPATGTQDPLLVKAIVLESQGVRLAYAILDVAALPRELGDRAVALASQATGIPPDHIAWSCTHSHTSPYTGNLFPWQGCPDPVNHAWLKELPAKVAAAIEAADAARVRVRLSRRRAYCSNVSHNRRLRLKGGREVNTWLLHNGEEDLQCLGAAGPIDPEIGILALDDEAGVVRAVLFHFTLHANANFGPAFSGDYPAVVAARLRERYGPQVVTLFLPGACGDINPIVRYRQVGDTLADAIIAQVDRRTPATGPVRLGGRRAEMIVPYRDVTKDQEQRLRESQWSAETQDYFRRNLAIMRKRGVREARTWVHAWRIGEVAFVGFPGELFVQWGLYMKEHSPFPWTYAVELCDDYQGYLVTRQAWKAGGYESLVSTVAPVAVDGVEAMARRGLRLLGTLWRER